MAEDLVVGEAQDTDAERFETGLPNGVVLALFVVNWPVDLDGQTNGGAVEVDDETVDRMLSRNL